MKRILLNDATDTQLRDFAANTLQLDVSAANTRPAVLGLITQAWPNDYIIDLGTVPDGANADQAQPARSRSAADLGASVYDDPIVRLKIRQTDQPGGRDPVPVGVNGDVRVIQRDLEADVPFRFFEALNRSERVIVTQNIDVKFGDPAYGDILENRITNYPIEVIERPSTAEIEAWRERTARIGVEEPQTALAA
jgi:hypothetical protein